MGKDTQFKPGEVNNPFGSLPIGEDLKQARKLTRFEFERVANKYLHMTWGEVERAFASREHIPAVEMIVLSIMTKAINEGDQKRLEFLLDRTIGQTVRKIAVKVEQEDDSVVPPVPMSDAEKVEMLNKMKDKINHEISKTQGAVIDVTAKKNPIP